MISINSYIGGAKQVSFEDASISLIESLDGKFDGYVNGYSKQDLYDVIEHINLNVNLKFRIVNITSVYFHRHQLTDEQYHVISYTSTGVRDITWLSGDKMAVYDLDSKIRDMRLKRLGL